MVKNQTDKTKYYVCFEIKINLMNNTNIML